MNTPFPVPKPGSAALSLALLCAGAVVPALSLRAESRADYLAEALRNNPKVNAAYERYLAARQVAPQVRALDEPVASYSEFLSSVQTRTGPQERIFSISQKLPWPGVLRLRGQVADAESAEAWFRYETARREVLESTGLAFIEYAYLKAATDRSEENLELLEQLEPVVGEKVRGGAPLATQLRLDVELATAKQDLDSLRKQRPGLSAQLKSLLGRDPGGDNLPWSSLDRSAPSLSSLETIRSETVRNHPRIRLAERGIATARRKEALADKSGKPTFNIGANAIDIGDGGETAGAVTLGVKLPLWRKKYRAEQEEAAAMARAAGVSLDAVKQELLARAAAQHAAQEEADQRLRTYDKELIPSAEQSLELTTEDYRNDKATLTDLIEAERVLLDLHLLRTRALADAHKAAWRIRALTEPLEHSSK